MKLILTVFPKKAIPKALQENGRCVTFQQLVSEMFRTDILTLFYIYESKLAFVSMTRSTLIIFLVFITLKIITKNQQLQLKRFSVLDYNQYCKNASMKTYLMHNMQSGTAFTEDKGEKKRHMAIHTTVHEHNILMS